MSELHFIRPLWLWALLPYALLLGLMLRNKLSQGNWAQVCDPELLPYLLLDKPSRLRRWPQITLLLAALLSIVALAGPTWQRLPAPVLRNDAALVIALDLSRSMDAEDIKPSRLIRARYKIADLLKRRKDGQTALLVYADEAFTVTPLTDDTETVNSQLSALNTGIMPGGGGNTAIALQKAADLLKQAGLQQGQILLLTDGVDSQAAIDAAKHLGAYKLSILAVGTAEGAPIKSAGAGFVKDAAGNIVVPKLDLGALQKLADAGGGILQSLRDDDSDIDRLQAVFERQTQAQLNPGAKDEQLMQQWRDAGPWLLLPVLPLAALAFRRGVLCFAMLLLLPWPQNSYAFSRQNLWQTPDQQGQQAFRQQHYEQAAERFDNQAWKAAAQYKAGHYDAALEALHDPQNADDFYNRGNALAQKGRLNDAVQAYDKALQLNPQHEDARYNKELVEKALQQQQEQQQDSQKQQEQAGDGEQQHDQTRQQQGEQEQQNSRQQAEQEGQQNPAERDASANEEQQARQAQAEEQKQQSTQANEQAQAAPDKPAEKNAADDAQQSVAEQQQPLDETRQADEQWLQRIPDDPSGLLRRKFAYQYQQRARKAQGNPQW
ncbi:MAG: VWA domain-containing protein [Gammaproteobacteria bacterium]